MYLQIKIQNATSNLFIQHVTNPNYSAQAESLSFLLQPTLPSLQSPLSRPRSSPIVI